MKSLVVLILMWFVFTGANAEEVVAPELHNDPFITPLLDDQKKAAQGLVGALDGLEQVSRSALLWKPELRGIIRSSDIAIVNIDGNMISMGEELEGYRLINVKERSVVFEKNGTYYPISLDRPGEAPNVPERSL